MTGSPATAEEAVERLRSLREGERAFGDVCRHGADAVPPLAALLAGPTEAVGQPRELAAEALAVIGGPAAADALLAALEDSAARDGRLPPVLREAESGVLSSLARALAELKDPRAPDALSRILWKRCHAGCLAALASFEDPRLVGFAVRCLRDGATSGPAAEALRLYGAASVAPLAETLGRPRLVRGAEPPTSAAGRALAATLLGELGGVGAGPALAAALDDPAPEVRLAAAVALARLGPDEASRAAPELARALGDSDTRRASEAEEALATLVPGAARALVPLLGTEAADEVAVRARLRALSLLGRLPSTEAVPVLATVVGHPDRRVRFAAATALGRSGSRAAAASLEALARDADGEVRSRARAALAIIAERAARPPALP